MKCLLAFTMTLAIASTCWGQPSTGYATATPDAPSSDGETGFSFIVDLADMPASWWSTAENTDATRGRVYRDDGTTELAVDWIAYDDAAETGFIRFKDDMAASPTTYRIYPPVSGNATVAASATYGSDNAYDANWAGYWANASVTDRTASGNDLSATGTPGSVAGPIGSAYEFDGSTNYVTGTVSGLDDPCVVISWGNVDDTTADRSICRVHDSADGTDNAHHMTTQMRGSAGATMRTRINDGSNTANATPTTTYTANTWHMLVSKHLGATEHVAILDADFANEDTATGSTTPNTFDEIWIGATSASALADPKVGEVQVHSADRSDEWIGEEYLQVSGNTAYWNGWTWTAGSSEGGDPNPLTFTIPGGTSDPLRRIIQ